MAAHNVLLATVTILGISVLAMQAESSQRVKRATPVVNEIYAMDHFIELVEKVEAKVEKIYHVADYIRSLAYNDGYWQNVIGPTKNLSDGILSSTEKNILKRMLYHEYDGTRELGVVRTTSGETIAVGSLVTGVLAGIYRKLELSLGGWASGASKTVDNLFAATISRVLAETTLAKKNTPSNAYFGPGGSWDSNECPDKYTKANSTIQSKASNALIIGAMDGFLLGYKIQSWARNVRLGQLFRMYYSTGVCFDNTYASCNRFTKFSGAVSEYRLEVMVEGVADAMYAKNKATYPSVKKEDLNKISKEVAEKFFKEAESIIGNQVCLTKDPGCELPANLVFLMDESSSIDKDPFKLEKEFISDIIDAFNISPRQTKVAVVEFANDAKIDMGLNLYGSKTRLKCAVKKSKQLLGGTNTAAALDLARTQIFLPLQNSASPMQSERSNIVILLTDGKANRPTNDAIYPAIDRIKNEVKDLSMIAVGVGSYDMQQLRRVATDPVKNVITSKNFRDLLTFVKELQNKTCSTPVNLKMNFRQQGNVTYIEAFVSPGRSRYFLLQSALFFGKSIRLKVKPQYGSLRLFASRENQLPGPDNSKYIIDPIPDGQSIDFYIPNPCSGAANVSMCKGLYLTIQHAESVKCTCTESKCFLPGQIKFRIEMGKAPIESQSNRTTPTSVFVVFIAIFTLLNTVFKTS